MVKTQSPQVFHDPDHPHLQHQVRWRQDKLMQAGIDQTRLAIAGTPNQSEPFSFLVMGDTDSGPPPIHKTPVAKEGQLPWFSSQFADQIWPELEDSAFVIHTGDIAYPLGNYRNYLEDFLEAYRWMLMSLPNSPDYRSDQIVFTKPFLPVPGNHDYANLPPMGRVWMGLIHPLCQGLRKLGIDLGGYGGYGGQAYGQTFLDDLARLKNPQDLSHYLAEHYQEETASGYGLAYQPGRFTRLPNRYYTFRYGGVDFFALDSNTWNHSPQSGDFDAEQLDWLEQRLIESWQTPEVIGRIIYLHHSPYTTEETRWQEPETLWVRRNLRSVLDRVAIAINPLLTQHKHTPIVNLILSGHAHCLEHIRTENTGHADAHLDWVVCGGSGTSLRRQRKAGSDILEVLNYQGRSYTDVVAKSQLYLGVKGQGSKRVASHSFLRIDVQPMPSSVNARGPRSRFVVRPYRVSHAMGQWERSPLRPLVLQASSLQPS